jgi:hypothetical protein
MMGPDDDYTLRMEERGDPFYDGEQEQCSVCGAASTIEIHDEEQSITVCALCGNDQ